MKYLLTIICLLFMKFSFACECEVKPIIDIRDVNESDLIFTGILTAFEKGEKITNLTFSVSKMLKGKVKNKSINFSIEMDEHHEDIFHHIDSIFIDQKWIIFSSMIKKNDEIVYKIKESNDSDYCFLSKPVIDSDSYLFFINETFKNPNSPNKTYFKNNTAFANGSLKNKKPVGIWKYYTRNDLYHYWEGTYVNGKRDKIWTEKALNSKNEEVIIKKEIYKDRILNERIEYNYFEEKKMHKFFNTNTIKKILYRDNFISAISIYNKISNTTTIEYFRSGKSINKIEKRGEVFLF